MPTLSLRITLETDLVITASSATIGGHRSLRRIPGRALLGACAAAGYADPRSFDLFHAGKVRFGDAYPEAGKGRALPVPLCLHRAKGAGASEPAINLAVAERPPEVQLEQLRDMLLDSDGRERALDTNYTMRTALSEEGSARDGFLFGMEALRRGQVFRATVSADDMELLEGVSRRLLDREHRLGRSRTAEFGRVRIEKAEEEPWPVQDGSTGPLVLWCVSDLALRDEHTGAPRLLPRGEDFGLEGARLSSARSFLRFGRYAPFNGKRRRPEAERQVILAGSVIVFEVDTLDLPSFRARLARGVGDYTTDGLGAVLAQPALLAGERVDIAPAAAHAGGTPNGGAPPPDDELGRWLGSRLKAEHARAAAWDASRKWSEQMKRYPVGTSQWGEVRRIAARARITGAAIGSLESELGARLGLVDEADRDAPSAQRTRGRGVSAGRWSAKRGGKTAAQCLLEFIKQSDLPGESKVVAVELLGARMARIKNQGAASTAVAGRLAGEDAR